MYKIRHAETKDIPTIVEMGQHFWNVTPWVQAGVSYNEDGVEDLLKVLIDEHLLMVADKDGDIQAFIGFVIVPFILQPQYTVAQELFFWVAPSLRASGLGGCLLDAAEDILKDVSDWVSMGELMTSTDMSKFYKDKGYVVTECIHTKVL